MPQPLEELTICEGFVGRVVMRLERLRRGKAQPTEKDYRRVLFEELDAMREEHEPSANGRRRRRRR